MGTKTKHGEGLRFHHRRGGGAPPSKNHPPDRCCYGHLRRRSGCVLRARVHRRAQGSSHALYGLGSGEEQDAENSIVTTFETFAGQDEWMEELLGDEYYVELLLRSPSP